jgi:hypothetical protein
MKFLAQNRRSTLAITAICLISTIGSYSYLSLEQNTIAITPVIAQDEQPLNQPQELPITAKFRARGQTIKLEVANSSEEQAMGLMFRTNLPDDRGMLFNFQPAKPVQFWMKNTLIPLDMIFLYRGKIKYIATDVPPCQGDPCPIYGPDSSTNIDQVIELRAGRSAELRLKVGSSLITKPIR